MRIPAILLVAALLAPAVAAALCDVTCVSAHARASAAPDERCHGHHQGGTGIVMTSVAAPFCHTAADAPRATLAPAAVSITLAVAVVPAGAIVSTSVVHESTARADSRPPPHDPPLLSTPLRI